MKTTTLWARSVKAVENSGMAQFMANDQRAHGLHAFSKFAKWKLCGQRHDVWVSQASAATGPISDYAENLLRKRPRYNIMCSN